MKVSFLLKMARQVEGDYVFVDIVYAHTDENKVWEWHRKHQNDLPTAERINDVDCVVYYGVHADIEVEDS